ncbi:MAG: hypothetical protein EBT55_01545 [Proteobacteria bacterium]|nr:hypothetical protein [Pseudomonadota bacterium]
MYECLFKGIISRNKRRFYSNNGWGWHKSRNLIIPKNIQIILLPPYCPELNCVERLWRFIKDNTRCLKL